MESFKACSLSTTGQAMYINPYGNVYLANQDFDTGLLSYMQRKRKRKNWYNGHPWNSLMDARAENKAKNRWSPVAPKTMT